MGFCCTDSLGYPVMGSDFNKVSFFNFLRGSRLRVSSISFIMSSSTNAMAFNLIQLELTVTQFRNSIQFSARNILDEPPIICYDSLIVTD